MTARTFGVAGVLARTAQRPNLPLSTGATLPRTEGCCDHQAEVHRLEEENARLRHLVEMLEGRRLNQRRLWSSEPIGGEPALPDIDEPDYAPGSLNA